MSDTPARQFSPAAERNREPILAVLQRVLPPSGRMLEVASGLGQHAAYFAAGLPQWSWQPTDVKDGVFESITAWTEGLRNVLPPLHLDAAADNWAPLVVAAAPYDAVFCANMIHVAPWDACLGLMRGVGQNLRPGGLLVMYGPYRIDGAVLEPSNAAFEETLRMRHPDWGLRFLSTVVKAAADAGLTLLERVAMPAHNHTLVFERNAP